jgi:hypothetical protein
MDLSSRAGLPEEPNEIQVNPVSLNRSIQLTELHDWCMQRLSELSIDWRMRDAMALTAEHLELLITIDTKRTLWMILEEDT